MGTWETSGEGEGRGSRSQGTAIRQRRLNSQIICRWPATRTKGDGVVILAQPATACQTEGRPSQTHCGRRGGGNCGEGLVQGNPRLVLDIWQICGCLVSGTWVSAQLLWQICGQWAARSHGLGLPGISARGEEVCSSADEGGRAGRWSEWVTDEQTLLHRWAGRTGGQATALETRQGARTVIRGKVRQQRIGIGEGQGEGFAQRIGSSAWATVGVYQQPNNNHWATVWCGVPEMRVLRQFRMVCMGGGGRIHPLLRVLLMPSRMDAMHRELFHLEDFPGPF
mmetsp:Transcript_7538/g.21357  ORF Transcript_7538/g.21357 Transcript_7538/m.21357 type:complete len:281 (+) Transcript_7538:484-1326(+)